METKKLVSHKMHSKQISYKKVAQFLSKLQAEFQLLADSTNDEKLVKATNYSTDNNVLFMFDDPEFCLSLDYIKKEVCHD